MAYTIPETIRSSATAGERLLFRTLKTYLPDDYIVYYEPEIRGRRPDFVIIGPDLGLVVLEVKDYTLSTLFHLNNDEWTIVNSAGEQATVKSPFKQARDNAFHIVDVLKSHRITFRYSPNGVQATAYRAAWYWAGEDWEM